MTNKMISKIMDDAAKMEAADNLMTEALQALEVFDYLEAYCKAQDVLDISENIEQRLAALFVQDLANRENGRVTQRMLEMAYDIDREETITVMSADILAAQQTLRENAELLEANQAATDRLMGAIDDLNATMLRIQATL